MGGLIARILRWFASNFLGRVLAGAGLAIASNYTFGIFIDYFISKAMGYIANIPMIGLIGVAGIDRAISILLTAAMIKIYLSSTTSGISIVKAVKK